MIATEISGYRFRLILKGNADKEILRSGVVVVAGTPPTLSANVVGRVLPTSATGALNTVVASTRHLDLSSLAEVIDTTFATAGVFTNSFDQTAGAFIDRGMSTEVRTLQGMAIDSAGKIYVTGYQNSGSNLTSFFIARLTTKGQLIGEKNSKPTLVRIK